MLRYYFSGLGYHTEWFQKWFHKQTPHRLLSLHGSYTKIAENWCKHLPDMDSSQTLLFDSGAFTAWNMGHEVTLDELLKTYDSFVSRYERYAKQVWLVSLDKIPGKPGVDPTAAEIAEAIDISDKNHEILVRTFGDRVLPVFHQGEDEKRLREVCALSKYICVSPRNDLHESQRVKWAREVHNKLPPGINTHGLAATGMDMMTTVPWYSVDSATWMFAATSGATQLLINGKLRTLSFSTSSPARHVAGAHYDTLKPSEQKVIDEFLEERKFSSELLRTDYVARLGATIVSIVEWNNKHHQFNISDVPTLFDM